MNVRVVCPNCSATFPVEDLTEPRRVRCVECGHDWRVEPLPYRPLEVRFEDLSAPSRARICELVRQLRPIDEPGASPEETIREFGIGEVDPGSGSIGTERETVAWLDDCMRQLADGIPANGWRLVRVDVTTVPQVNPVLVSVAIQAYGDADGRVAEARQFTMVALKQGADRFWRQNGTRYEQVQDVDA